MNILHRTTRSARRAFYTFLALISVAIIASPVAASTGSTGMDRGAVAMIAAFGLLLLGIVFEVWRMALRHPEPARNRATSEWGAKRPD